MPHSCALALAATALCAAPAAGDTYVTVRADGSGEYTSVQAVLDALNPAEHAAELGHVTVSLQGRFFERVNVYSNFSGGVTFIGAGPGPADNLIEFNVSGAAGPGTFGSWTFKSDAPNVTLVNVAIANSADGYDHKAAGQSVALHLTSQFFDCWNCSLWGAQDTLYTGDVYSRSYFHNTFINGSCDALFGGSASVFDSCLINMSFTVTAQRGNGSTAYLIQNSRIEVPEGDVLLLGRPWGPNATVVLKNTFLGEGVERSGWDDWGHNCTVGHSSWCDGVVYAEFNSTGPGADPGGRPWWTRQLSPTEAAQWTPARVLGGWVPTPPTLRGRSWHDHR